MRAIEITTKIGCLNNCIFCPQDKLIKKYNSDEKLMSLEGFVEYIDGVPSDVDIHFSGFCEPWQNPFCAEMILYAHKKGHKVSVFTTLVGATKKDILKIKDIPFGYFSVHLPSADNLEKISVDIRYLKMLFFLMKTPLKATFHFHGSGLNEKVKKYFTKLNMEILPRAINDRAKNAGLINSSIKEKKTNNKRISCQRIYHNVLLPNGDVVLCCMDYGKEHVLGNLKRDNYYDLFKKDEFLNIKRGMGDVGSDILCRRCSEPFKSNIYD